MQEEILSSMPRAQYSRRDFVKTMLSSGFALAVQPVSAETITTDTEGLRVGETAVGQGYDTIPAYYAMPAQGAQFPVVLVVQEIFGVHEHIKDVCRRLAKAGYLAIAPELFARQGDVSKLKDINEIREKIVSKVPDRQVLRDLDSAASWAAANKGNALKLGITGFCYGGRIVWLYAAHNADLKAGVAWYGRLLGAPNEMQPKHPVDLAKEIKAPVLGLYGADDQGIPVSDVEDMRAELKAAGRVFDIVLYPNAPHGFHADYRASYRKQAAQDGWRRMLEWFRKHGVA